MQRWLYELLYRQRLASVDRIFGSTDQIERLAESIVTGRQPLGRVATLGCGVGRESIALARLGFDVTGVDFSPTAIKRARASAARNGVAVRFVIDDLTDLKHIRGPFDLITDFGALNDLRGSQRKPYLENLLSLTHARTVYFMFCFRRKLAPSVVHQLFDDWFAVEVFELDSNIALPNSLDCYLMHRRGSEE